MRPASTHVPLAIAGLALVAPLLASFAFSYDRDIAWLLQSLLFLLLAFACAALLALRLSNRTLRFALVSAVATPLLLLETLRLVSYYLQGEGFNERFFFHLNLNTLTQCWTVYPRLTWSIVALLLGFQALLYLGLRHEPARDRPRALPLWAPVAAALLLPFLDSAPRAFWTGYEQVRARTAGAPFAALGELEALGLRPEAIGQPTVEASPGKSLVFLYLEGLESLYTDPDVFPGLTPELNALAARGLRFTGLRQVEGTGWTMGGMVASQCGTPLLIDGAANGNDIMQNGFLTEAVCLGDVLAAAGYRQAYLGGARLDFAGKGAFYAAHGYDEALGLREFRERGTASSDTTWWGLYDETLFDRAEAKLRELGEGGRPFNLTLLTLDTHAPSGAASRDCAPYTGAAAPNPMLDAVHCTDQLVGRFLDRLSTQPAMQHTVVALMSDHLMMRNAADDLYPPDRERTLYLAVLNAGVQGVRDTPGTAMDVAPTLLDLMGVRHDAAFLAGHSLVAAEADRPAPDFDDRRVSDGIRWVNTNLLTRQRTRLCDAASLVRYDAPDHLDIGARRVALAYEGWPERFRERFAEGKAFVVAFVDPDGVVGEVAIVRGRALPGLLQQHADDVFLMVASRSALQRALPALAGSADEVYVVLGKLGGQAEVLGTFATLEDVAIGAGGCEARLAAARGAQVERAGGG